MTFGVSAAVIHAGSRGSVSDLQRRRPFLRCAVATHQYRVVRIPWRRKVRGKALREVFAAAGVRIS